MDVEGTMQFILEQQAKFSADIDVFKEAVSRQGENISRLNEAIDEVVQSQKNMSEYLGQLTGVVASLADSVSTVKADQQMLSRNLMELTGVVTKLADSSSDVEVKASVLEAQAEADRAEIREAIGKLISSEEETRRFAIEIAQLVKQHESRIAKLEDE
jgi:chromosome segregation ATPase